MERFASRGSNFFENLTAIEKGRNMKMAELLPFLKLQFTIHFK